MTKWVLLGAAIVSEVSASLALRAAVDRPWLYVLVVLGYLAALRLLVLLMRRGVALGLAYGIWGALGVAGTALMSTVLYRESLSTISWIGLGLVMAGVLVVEAGSRSAEAGRRGRG